VDTSAIVLTMDDGMPVVIDGSRHDPRGYDVRVELLGSEDAVVAGLGERTPLVRATSPPPVSTWRSFAERFAAAFAAETAAFLRLVREGGDSPCPPASALEALRVAVACDLSRAEGRVVTLAEVA
jgi:myo-inositol 2-dehydrogenase / D-chiro-inositol 1-dehydrogenase